MSIIVNKLTKQFGAQLAVNELSFEAKAGRILGFLGPNGAGKSTTMKMLTGYLNPTNGTITLGNENVVPGNVKVKKLMGYLPENTPLYQEMYVKEFLNFVGETYQLRDLKNRVAEVINLVGLAPEQHKKLSMLSKGYKQRVGLAQAIIHDPEVLILDEPTSGLDPNQLTEIRALIKELGKTKTVIISTHIMQEVEALCDDVIIINNGKLVANSSVESLKQENRSSTLEEIFKKLTA